jgi:hypothetical protein
MRDFIMWPYRVFAHGTSVLLLVSLLAGCSMLRLGYANAETFTYWWLDGYVPFSDDQEPQVQEYIDKFFAWHCKTQLTEYAQSLTRAQQHLQHPATAADADAVYIALKECVFRMVDHALPGVADLALSLTPHQIAHMEKNSMPTTRSIVKSI